MNKLVLTWLFILAVSSLFAQADITAAEYFIDEDPGQGLGTSITVTQGQSIDVSFTIPTSSMGLSEGFHLLGIRTQDENGDWSIYEMRGFIIQPNVGVPSPSPADIDLLEYFIDEDPGVGSGISIVGAGATVNVNEIISGLGIPDGFHAIGVRARNTDSRWGFTDLRAFYIQDIDGLTSSEPLEITELEYFIDEDPGHGNGQTISVIQNLVIDVDELISVTEVTPGFHTISVRAKDENNQWGFTETRVFYVQNIDNTPDEISPIVAMEYFIDEDPGYGQGIPISTSAGNVVDITSIQLSLVDSYPIGDHTITIRAQNEDGKWGFGETREFMIDGDCPVAGFEVAKACVGEEMFLSNISTSVLGEADYRWYADGVLISNEEDNVSNTFNSPGNHTISLAITNGLLCTDSTGVNIEVKPKPVVVFNAESVTVGEISQFVVDTFNLDQSSAWEWDFDGDGSVDDITPGNTSFQYSDDGTYTAMVTITDEDGCGTSFSRDIIVHPTETQPNPTALFEVDVACAGQETTFMDLSTDIPDGSIYQWDFDGDGTTDATGVGITTYTYPESGDFTAELTITTPDSEETSHIEEVVIQDVPVVEFDFSYETDGVESATVSFINLSEGNGLDFSWDFDGLGSSALVSPKFIFENYEGVTYTICLSGSNQCDDITICKDITFTPVNNTPASAIFETDAGCVGIEATFEDLSTNIPEGSTYAWDFDGDGTTDATDAGNVTYTYSEAGFFEAELIITSEENDQISYSKEITIQDPPVVDFSFSYDTDLDKSATVNFVNLSEGSSVDFSWDFNGNGTSSALSPTFTFDDFVGKSYTVCLTASNQCPEVTVCKDIDFEVTGIGSFESREIKLYPNPTKDRASLDLSSLENDNLTVQIIDLSGKIHKFMNIKQVDNSITHLPSLEKGTYLIMVKTEHFWVREKLIVL